MSSLRTTVHSVLSIALVSSAFTLTGHAGELERAGASDGPGLALRAAKILTLAREGLVTDVDIEREVFISDSALDQLTAKLVKEGDLVRDGAGYRTPAAVTV